MKKLIMKMKMKMKMSPAVCLVYWFWAVGCWLALAARTMTRRGVAWISAPPNTPTLAPVPQLPMSNPRHVLKAVSGEEENGADDADGAESFEDTEAAKAKNTRVANAQDNFTQDDGTQDNAK